MGSDDSTSRMSMSTIFDGGAGVKFRQKNKSSPPDITKVNRSFNSDNEKSNRFSPL